MSTVAFVCKQYLMSKDVDDCVRRIKKHIFINSNKEKLTERFMLSIALEYLSELQGYLFDARFNIQESKYYNEDNMHMKPLTEKQELEIIKVSELINARWTVYRETKSIKTDYQDMIEDYCVHIQPSIQKRGDLSYTLVQRDKKYISDLKDENKVFFDIVKEANKNMDVSIDLLMMVFEEHLRLVRIGETQQYQINLKNDDIIKIMHGYCERVNVPYYKNEYNKVSNIRTVVNRVAEKIFTNFKVTKDEYFIRKCHARLLFELKIAKRESLFSKSINNHYISFHELIVLLRKPLVLLHSITLKYTNSVNEIDEQTSSHDNSS